MTKKEMTKRLKLIKKVTVEMAKTARKQRLEMKDEVYKKWMNKDGKIDQVLKYEIEMELEGWKLAKEKKVNEQYVSGFTRGLDWVLNRMAVLEKMANKKSGLKRGDDLSEFEY